MYISINLTVTLHIYSSQLNIDELNSTLGVHTVSGDPFSALYVDQDKLHLHKISYGVDCSLMNR